MRTSLAQNAISEALAIMYSLRGKYLRLRHGTPSFSKGMCFIVARSTRRMLDEKSIYMADPQTVTSAAYKSTPNSKDDDRACGLLIKWKSVDLSPSSTLPILVGEQWQPFTSGA
jgi:hypothetical protein